MVLYFITNNNFEIENQSFCPLSSIIMFVKRFLNDIKSNLNKQLDLFHQFYLISITDKLILKNKTFDDCGFNCCKHE